MHLSFSKTVKMIKIVITIFDNIWFISSYVYGKISQILIKDIVSLEAKKLTMDWHKDNCEKSVGSKTDLAMICNYKMSVYPRVRYI